MTDLSPRQEQIVDLVVMHRMSYREVAEELGISVHTVVSHAADIKRKLDSEEPPQKAMATYCRERAGIAA